MSHVSLIFLSLGLRACESERARARANTAARSLSPSSRQAVEPPSSRIWMRHCSCCSCIIIGSTLGQVIYWFLTAQETTTTKKSSDCRTVSPFTSSCVTAGIRRDRWCSLLRRQVPRLFLLNLTQLIVPCCTFFKWVRADEKWQPTLNGHFRCYFIP